MSNVIDPSPLARLANTHGARVATYSVKLYQEREQREGVACIIKRYSADGGVQIVGIGTADSGVSALRIALEDLRTGGPVCQHV